MESSEIELEDVKNKEDGLRTEIQAKIGELKEFEQQDNELRQKIDELTAQKYKVSFCERLFFCEKICFVFFITVFYFFV